MRRPILVTGSHRSGTTWVGRMLCLSGEAGYIHEPFNPVRRPSWLERPVPYWYVYVTERNEHLYAGDLERAMTFDYPVTHNIVRLRRPEHAGIMFSDISRTLRPRFTRARPLLKDPFALFSAEWLQRRYDADVVITVRSPIAFAGSIKRLNWQFKFKTLLGQGALMHDWLRPFEKEMRRCRDADVDVVEQGIVLWNALHHAIAELGDRHPDWSVVRHEDLSRDPDSGFEALYRVCDLRWDSSVADQVRSFSTGDAGRELPMWRHGSVKRDSASASETWKLRLSDEEVERVRAGTKKIAKLFYEGEDGITSPTTSSPSTSSPST